MYNYEAEKKQKHKLLAIAGVMVAVIIVLVAAIVVVSTGKNTKKSIDAGQNTETTVTENSESGNDAANVSETESGENAEVSAVGTITTGVAEETNTNAVTEGVVEKSADLPNTGPEDLVPIAIVMGILTTVATAVAMRERKN